MVPLDMEPFGIELLGIELLGMEPGAAGGIDPDIVASPGTVMVVSRKTPPPPTLPCTRAFCGLFIKVRQSWRWLSGRLMQRLVASCL